MLGLLTFDWNAWMGSRMDHFAENDKNQKHTLNTGTSLIYALMQLNFSYLKAQNNTINPIEVSDVSISQSFLTS